MQQTRANQPLAGVTVLDFGQVYQGPYATMLMAKAGADVIKIEPPNGEPLRRRAPPGKSTTFPIAMLNSNKRAITLNLKHERGRALLFRMLPSGRCSEAKPRSNRGGASPLSSSIRTLHHWRTGWPATPPGRNACLSGRRAAADVE